MPTRESTPQEEQTATALVGDLFDEVHPDLMRFLVGRIRDAGESEELAQEVFLRLLKSDKAASLRNPRAYLFRIATNTLIDWGRLKRRRIRLEQWSTETAEPSDRTADAFEQALWRERMKLLSAAVDELPERCRRALVLHRSEGWTYDEVAKDLGVSKSMVQKYLRRALVTCRNALDESAGGELASGTTEVSR